MHIKLNNDDFILGVLAASGPDLRVDWIAAGSIEHVGGSVGYDWQLISHASHDVHMLVLVNSEGGVEWKEALSGVNKREVTEGLIAPFCRGEIGGLPNLAAILTSDGASANHRRISKRLLVRALSEWLEGSHTSLDLQNWKTRFFAIK